MPTPAQGASAAPSASAAASPEPGGFSVLGALELDRQSLPGRLAFAGLYALISLLVVRWPLVAAWVGAILALEVGSALFINPAIAKLDERRAIPWFALSNIAGSS